MIPLVQDLMLYRSPHASRLMYLPIILQEDAVVIVSAA